MGFPPVNVDGSLREPLDAPAVKKLARQIYETGEVGIDNPHLLDELRKDDLEMGDVINAIRCGVMNPRYPGEWEGGEYRYRITTSKITVVVSFPSPTQMAVITAWRN